MGLKYEPASVPQDGMADYFDGKVTGGGGGKKGAVKKEDRAAFLARTQATRQNRQVARDAPVSSNSASLFVPS